MLPFSAVVFRAFVLLRLRPLPFTISVVCVSAEDCVLMADRSDFQLLETKLKSDPDRVGGMVFEARGFDLALMDAMVLLVVEAKAATQGTYSVLSIRCCTCEERGESVTIKRNS
jgi:hypothetical protein